MSGLFAVAIYVLGSGVGVAVAVAADQTSGGWRWPVDPVQVLRGFEAPEGPYGSGHRGIDLAASIGQVVHAPAAGEVSFVGVVGGLRVLVIGHGALRSTFQPVAASVVVGANVTAGQVVGATVAGPPHCLVSCVHWGVLRGSQYVDPLALLGTAPPRLLPYWDLPPPGGDGELADRDRSAAVEAPARSHPGDAQTVGATDPRDGRDAVAPASPARTQVRLVSLSLSLASGGLLAWLLVVLLRRRL